MLPFRPDCPCDYAAAAPGPARYFHPVGRAQRTLALPESRLSTIHGALKLPRELAVNFRRGASLAAGSGVRARARR